MFVPKKILLLLALMFGLSFLFFTQLVKKDLFEKLDFDLIVKLQDKTPENSHPVFTLTSTLSSFEIATFFVGILTIFLLFRRKWGAIFLLPSLAVAHIVEIYGKTVIDHQAPPMYFVKEFDTVLFPAWYSHPLSSYPSGHAMRAVFLGIVVMGLVLRSKFNKRLQIVFIICHLSFIILSVLGRVVLGTHWPTDVVGGVLLGAAFGLFALLFI